MAAQRYPAYRRPASRRYYARRRNNGSQTVVVVVVAFGAALGYANAHHPGHAAAVHPATASAPKASTPKGHHATVTRVVTPAAATAVAYAEKQIGKPYVWAATGPDSFDCSGLVMQAWAAAGVSIPRTTYTQWASLPHVPVGQVRAGDLVLFAGGDGTRANPGHVGIVVDPAKHTMVEAYETGTNIRISVYGEPSSPLGDEYPVGYARPGGTS